MPKILSDEEVQEIKKRTKIQSNWDKETVLDLIATIESETDLFNAMKSFMRMNVYGKLWIISLLVGSWLIYFFVDSPLGGVIAYVGLLILWVFVGVTVLREKLGSEKV